MASTLFSRKVGGEESPEIALVRLRNTAIIHIRAYLQYDNPGKDGVKRAGAYLAAINDTKTISTKKALLDKLVKDFMDEQGVLNTSIGLRGRIGDALCQHFGLDQAVHLEYLKLLDNITSPSVGLSLKSAKLGIVKAHVSQAYKALTKPIELKVLPSNSH
jgi:hypothetical protein